jgi:hypothetical protein
MACTPVAVAGTAFGGVIFAAEFGFCLPACAAAARSWPSPIPGIAVTGRPLLPKTAGEERLNCPKLLLNMLVPVVNYIAPGRGFLRRIRRDKP